MKILNIKLLKINLLKIKIFDLNIYKNFGSGSTEFCCTFFGFFIFIFAVFMSGCSGNDNFDTFDDINVPKGYVEFKNKQEKIKSKQKKPENIIQNTKKTASFTTTRQEKSFPFSKQKSGTLHKNYLHFVNPVPLDKKVAFTRALNMLDNDQNEFAIDKLEHLASLSTEYPELCSQIFFKIAEYHETKGNIKKANLYYDKFHNTLDSLRSKKNIVLKKKSLEKSTAGFDKYYVKPNLEKELSKND
jgi:hypothetical protein